MFERHSEIDGVPVILTVTQQGTMPVLGDVPGRTVDTVRVRFADGRVKMTEIPIAWRDWTDTALRIALPTYSFWDARPQDL